VGARGRVAGMDEQLSIGEAADTGAKAGADEEEEEDPDPQGLESGSLNPLASMQKKYDEMIELASIVQLKVWAQCYLGPLQVYSLKTHITEYRTLEKDKDTRGPSDEAAATSSRWRRADLGRLHWLASRGIVTGTECARR